MTKIVIDSNSMYPAVMSPSAPPNVSPSATDSPDAWHPEVDADRGEQGVLRYRKQFDDNTECMITMVTITAEGKPDWGWMLLETIPAEDSIGLPLNFEFGFPTWEAAAEHFTQWVETNQPEHTEPGAVITPQG